MLLLQFLSYPLGQHNGAHYEERVVEDGSPEHCCEYGYRGIGQIVGVIKAEHQFGYAAAAGCGAEYRNHPHHPLSAPGYEHVALALEGEEYGGYDGEAGEPCYGGVAHETQPEAAAFELCLLRG